MNLLPLLRDDNSSNDKAVAAISAYLYPSVSRDLQKIISSPENDLKNDTLLHPLSASITIDSKM